MVSQADLEVDIREKVQNVSALVVSDVSGGCGQAYDVIIVSDVFEGLPTLKRHRMVNDLLKEQIAQLHAFSQKTYTTKQYSELSGTSASSSAAAVEPAKTRPAMLDTSVAQRGARVHHRSTSSNVSVPELTLTTDGPDETSFSGASATSSSRPITPSESQQTTILPDMGSGNTSISPGAGSSISRLHYNRVTSVDFWSGLRDYLEKSFIGQQDGSASPSNSPVPGHVKGEAELVKVFEDFLQSQKVHLSASDVAKVRDGTGMFGM